MASTALFSFAAFTYLHVPLILARRSFLIFSGQKKPTEFGKSRDGPEITVWSRIGKSHANCVENLILFATIILLNRAYGSANLDGLAWYVVYCRIGQIISHCASVSELAITFRFMFFVAQLVFVGIMGYRTYQTIGPIKLHYTF